MVARRMTAARKAALRKAQLASARARKGRGKHRLSPRTKRNLKRAAVGAALVGGVALVAASRTNRGKANTAVAKRIARQKQLNHYKNRQQRTFKKSARSQRATVRRARKAVGKAQRKNPQRYNARVQHYQATVARNRAVKLRASRVSRRRK
jgi:hypothetical protein